MAENQFLSVLRVWASVAWADGVIVDAEAVAYRQLVKRAELDDDDEKTALGWLDSSVGLDTDNIQSLKVETREGIYETAARISMVDHEIAIGEIKLLERLREGLQISDDRATELESAGASD